MGQEYIRCVCKVPQSLTVIALHATVIDVDIPLALSVTVQLHL
jgi:hypothetical protein